MPSHLAFAGFARYKSRRAREGPGGCSLECNTVGTQRFLSKEKGCGVCSMKVALQRRRRTGPTNPNGREAAE